MTDLQMEEGATTGQVGASSLLRMEIHDSDNTGINLVEIQDLISAPSPTAA